MKTAEALHSTHDASTTTKKNYQCNRPLANVHDVLPLPLLPLPMLTEPSRAGSTTIATISTLRQHQYPARTRTQTPARAPTSQPTNDKQPTKGWITHHRFLTSQCCTAVSIDTCTAIARFLNRLWERTRARVAYPRVFAEPVPVLVETRTPGHGHGFSGVRVRVALENPRVTRANPYSHHHHLPRIQTRAGGGPFQWFQGICCRCHITTTHKLIMAKMDKRGRGR